MQLDMTIDMHMY